MSRHPYTHSADFIRTLGPITGAGVVLSRADASAIRSGIAAAIGMTDEELAIKLSDAEQSKTDDEIDAFARRVMSAVTGA